MGVAVVAVDFGAASIRVCRVELGAGVPVLEVVHRYAHLPAADAQGVLRWDWAGLQNEMNRGLALALQRGPVASIGIDTWGVDFGLLDARGALVAPPVSYRDQRTSSYLATVERLGGVSALYATTGLQLQPFNTLFQVACLDREELARARHLLLLPELLVHHLTGEIVAERTSAGTTALVDITTGEWSTRLAETVGLDPQLLPEILPATTQVGTWQGIPVHLVGGHDTASAAVAMGPGGGAAPAFVSAGTWLLVGREQDQPDLSAAAVDANFTNEIGAMGGIRFLKNLAGAWLVEQCRSAWGDPPVADLLAAASEQAPQGEAGLDVANPDLLNPDDMLAAVTKALALPPDVAPPRVVRGIVEAHVAGTMAVLDQLGRVTAVHVSGGAQSDLYRRLLAERSGLPVVAGPAEATALGNALVQGIALGVYRDLDDARSHLDGVR